MDIMDVLLSAKLNKNSDGSSGTTNYNQLTNKPKINNIELSGNKTLTDLGIAARSDIPEIPVSDIQINDTSILSNGVANIPIAGTSSPGVVQVDADYGTSISNDRVRLVAAGSDQVKVGTHQARPIVPSTQHAAAFYGLAKAAGDTTQAQSENAVGTYTDEAKSAIRTMLETADVNDLTDWTKININGPKYTWQVDKDNNVYKLRSIIPLLGEKVDACAAVGACYANEKFYFTYIFAASNQKNKQIVSWERTFYYAKSWSDSYNPDTDGILTEDNAPHNASGTPQHSATFNNAGWFMMYLPATTRSSPVEGDAVFSRIKLVITYNDGSTKTIWSSQINITYHSNNPLSINYMNDLNTINQENDIICAGWDICDNIAVEDNTFEYSRFYSLLWDNVDDAQEKDRFITVKLSDLTYEGYPQTLSQFIIFSNGNKKYYNYFNDPGII